MKQKQPWTYIYNYFDKNSMPILRIRSEKVYAHKIK